LDGAGGNTMFTTTIKRFITIAAAAALTLACAAGKPGTSSFSL